jgi:hypothetical protein
MKHMLTNDADVFRAPTPAEDLHRLIRSEGLKRYGTFFVTGEGKRLPDGSENGSGYVIDEQGRVFSFWLDWDHERQETVFTEWAEVHSESNWPESAEYQEARAAAGLTAE